MIPARDRQTVLRIYSTKADMLANTNYTDYSEGIVSGTARIERTYFTQLPAFASCNASMFECEVGINVDLTGKWIRVASEGYATDAATTRTTYWLFAGLVDSCRYDSRQNTRKVVAYDEMLQLRGLDVSAWWASYWESAADSVNASTVIGDMCTEFSVTLSGTFSADFAIKKAGVKTLTGFSFAQVLAYVAQIIGAVFYVDEDGKLIFDYVSAALSATAVAVDTNVDTNQSEFNDTNITPYSSFFAYEGADVVYSNGSASPTFVIRDNAMTKGQTTSELSTTYGVTNTALSSVTGIRGGKVVLIVSAPDETFTRRMRKISVGANSYLIGGVILSGAQLIEQTLTCTAEMASDSYSASQIAQANNLTKMGVEMTFKVNADSVIEAVNLEAQGGVTINAEALNINGVVSANSGFKVNLDGSMEATAGKIAGWSVTDDGLVKEYTIDNNNYRMRLVSSATEGVKIVIERDYGSGHWIPMSQIDKDGKMYLNAQGGGGQIMLYASQTQDQIARLAYNILGLYDNLNIQNRYSLEISPKHFYLENVKGDVQMMSDYGHTDIVEIKPENIKLTYEDTHSSPTYPYVSEAAIEINPNYAYSSSVRMPFIDLQAERISSATAKTKERTFVDTVGIYCERTNFLNDTRVNGTSFNLVGTGLTFKNGSPLETRGQYLATTAKIDDRIFGTCNLIDMASLEQGGINGDGSEFNSSARVRTAYISVKGDTTYTISCNTVANPSAVRAYNSSKTVLTTYGNADTHSNKFTFTTSANTTYIRIIFINSTSATSNVSVSDISWMQLEKGGSASSYVPYAMDNVELTERSRGKKTYFTPSNCTANANYDSCYYYKEGDIVHLHMGCQSPTSKNATYEMSGLPVGYRPKAYVATCGWASDTGATIVPVWVWVRNNGVISFNTQGNYFIVDLCFLAEG